MFKKWQLKIIEEERIDEFAFRVNSFYRDHHRVRSNKFQRNLYYENGTLVSSYVAFIIYK